MRFIAVLSALALSAAVHAEPFAEASADGGAKVQLHKEPCALIAVTNLSQRATWEEKSGKVHDGCFGLHPWGVLVFYFSDKTVVLMSPQDFSSISST